MKRSLITLLSLITLISLISPVYAATATPSAAPTDTKTRQIEDLKERLATKVAELRQTQRRAIHGTVKSTSVSTVTVETKTKDVKIELTDDIKVIQFLRGVRTKLSLDAVVKGDVVTIFGEYDATLDLLKAKVIFIQAALPLRVSGTVTAVDKVDFTLTVLTPEGPSYTIDIEKTTKVTSWNKEKGLVKAGFSNIAVGDTVHAVGTTVPKKENRISALRVLDIGNLSGVTPTPIPTETTPKASPTTTPKTTPKP